MCATTALGRGRRASSAARPRAKRSPRPSLVRAAKLRARQFGGSDSGTVRSARITTSSARAASARTLGTVAARAGWPGSTCCVTKTMRTGRFEGTGDRGARLSEMGSDQARAVTVHQEQAGLFESRYEQFERDPYYDSFTYSRRKLEQVLTHYLDPLPDGARLLDVGCGTGNLLERLGGRFACAGCDPAEEMLRRARDRNPEAELKVAAAEALPFENASFDAVLCIEVVRYLADPDP